MRLPSEKAVGIRLAVSGVWRSRHRHGARHGMPCRYATMRTTARRLRWFAALTFALVVGSGSPAFAQPTPQELIVDGLVPGDRFGFAVAAAATSIAVGAPSASTAESAVYLFEAQAGKWVLTTAFTSTSPVERDLYGASVAMEDDVIVIG